MMCSLMYTDVYCTICMYTHLCVNACIRMSFIITEPSFPGAVCIMVSGWFAIHFCARLPFVAVATGMHQWDRWILGAQ